MYLSMTDDSELFLDAEREDELAALNAPIHERVLDRGCYHDFTRASAKKVVCLKCGKKFWSGDSSLPNYAGYLGDALEAMTIFYEFGWSWAVETGPQDFGGYTFICRLTTVRGYVYSGKSQGSRNPESLIPLAMIRAIHARLADIKEGERSNA